MSVVFYMTLGFFTTQDVLCLWVGWWVGAGSGSYLRKHVNIYLRAYIVHTKVLVYPAVSVRLGI